MWTEEGVMSWETRADKCTPPCVRHRASGNPLYRAGSSARCSVMTQVGGMGGVGRSSKGEGTYVSI